MGKATPRLAYLAIGIALANSAGALPITHYEPGYGNAGPIVLVPADPSSAVRVKPTKTSGPAGESDGDRSRPLLMGIASPALTSKADLYPAFVAVEDNLPPSVTLVHDHWINNRGYKSESGTHCCDHRSSNGDCDEIDPDTIKPTPDGQGYLTPKGRVGNRSTYISEDGKTYLCSPPNGPPRCLFIRSGG